MNNGPPPSTLTLLSNLRDFEPGSKVRFLGCVASYSTKTACLTLEHNYPPGSTMKAEVDASLVLNTLKTTETRIGEWLNVIGYIEIATSEKSTKRTSATVKIQAIVVWPTGPIKLQAYEQSLDKGPQPLEKILSGKEE